jgi:hypothetical protein
VIRVYDEADNVIATHEHTGDFTPSGCVNPHFAVESSDGFANHETRMASGWPDIILVKRSLRRIVVWLSIFTVIGAADVVKAGPFLDFFRSLRSTIAHPNEKPRSHRSSRKHNETPPSDAPTSETSPSPAPGPPGEGNIRVAKAASGTKHGKTNLPYGSPVPGQSGLVTSPFAPDSGYVDVSGFPHGTKVKDPYTGNIFLTP